MAYQPQIHNRKSIRLKGYDYSDAGAYFITICTHNKEHHLGSITSGEMHLNEFGKIAIDEWIALGERYKDIEPGVFVIMPNHMHGVLHILGSSRAGAEVNPAPTVGDIICTYKSLVSRSCLHIIKPDETMGKLWQRNYYEHIIRNEASYNQIADYILNNPASWENDRFY